MREFGAEANIKFVGAVGDRAANERGARELCCENGEVIFSLSCAAHGIHNMVKEMCQIPLLQQLVAKAKQIVLQLTDKRKTKAILRYYLKNNTKQITNDKGRIIEEPAPCRMLCVYYDIRWGSVNFMFERLYMGERAMKTMYFNEVMSKPALKERLEFGSEFTEVITESPVNEHDGFFNQCKAMCIILGPSQTGLVTSEAAYANQSIMYSCIRLITVATPKLVQECFGSSTLTSEVQRILEDQIPHTVTPVMHTAFLLDATQLLSDDNFILRNRDPSAMSRFKTLEIQCLRQYVTHFSGKPSLIDTLDAQIIAYKNRRGPIFEHPVLGTRAEAFLKSIQGKPFEMRREANNTFWREYGVNVPELRHLAIILNNMPASSSSAENNFSQYVAMSEGRQNLGKRKRDDLIFVQHNQRLLDHRLQVDLSKKAEWRRKTSSNYVKKLQSALKENKIIGFKDVLRTEYKSSITSSNRIFPSSSSAIDETMKEDNNEEESEEDVNDAPDWIDEAKNRLKKYNFLKQSGRHITLSMHSEMAHLQKIVGIFFPGVAQVAIDGMNPAPLTTETPRNVCRTTKTPPSTTTKPPLGPVGGSFEIESHPSPLLQDVSICNCDDVATLKASCASTGSKPIMIKLHAALALCDADPAEFPTAKSTCYPIKGWARSDVVSALIASVVSECSAALGFVDDRTFGGKITVLDVITLENGCDYDKELSHTLNQLRRLVRHPGRDDEMSSDSSLSEGASTAQDKSSKSVRRRSTTSSSSTSAAASSPVVEIGGDIVSHLLMLPTCAHNHYSLILVFHSYYMGQCVVTELEGFGNTWTTAASATKRIIERMKLFANVTRYDIPEGQSFLHQSTKDAGFLIADSVFHIINCLAEKLQSSTLVFRYLSKFIKEAFADSLKHSRWPKMEFNKPLSKRPALTANRVPDGRLAVSTLLFNNLCWASGHESTKVAIRRELKLPRPTTIVQSVWEALKARDAHLDYRPLLLDEVFKLKKSETPDVVEPSYQFDIEKFEYIASRPDEYRIAFYYGSKSYGFIVANFADFKSRGLRSDAPSYHVSLSLFCKFFIFPRLNQNIWLGPECKE